MPRGTYYMGEILEFAKCDLSAANQVFSPKNTYSIILCKFQTDRGVVAREAFVDGRVQER